MQKFSGSALFGILSRLLCKRLRNCVYTDHPNPKIFQTRPQTNLRPEKSTHDFTSDSTNRTNYGHKGPYQRPEKAQPKNSMAPSNQQFESTTNSKSDYKAFSSKRPSKFRAPKTALKNQGHIDWRTSSKEEYTSNVRGKIMYRTTSFSALSSFSAIPRLVRSPYTRIIRPY